MSVFGSLLTDCCAAAGHDNYSYIMDHAGMWTEKKKDGNKGGQKLSVKKMGPFLVRVTALNSPHIRLSQHSRCCTVHNS